MLATLLRRMRSNNLKLLLSLAISYICEINGNVDCLVKRIDFKLLEESI